MHDVKKLPKWAQKIIKDQEFQIKRLQCLEKTHAILNGRSWFTIPCPTNNRVIHLWTLHENGAHSICSLGKNDVLVVGRGGDEH